MMVFSFFPASFLFFVHDSLPAKPQGVRSSTSLCVTGRAFTTAAYNSAAPVAVLEVREYHHHPTAPGVEKWSGKIRDREGQCLALRCPGPRSFFFLLSLLYFQSPRCLLVHTSLCHCVVTLLSRQVFYFSLVSGTTTAC